MGYVNELVFRMSLRKGQDNLFLETFHYYRTVVHNEMMQVSILMQRL